VEGTAKAVACRRWLRVAAADQFTWADGYVRGGRKDGYVLFYEDGSTTLNITIPPGDDETSLDRLAGRLQKLAADFHRDEA
jgi:hypothetical protein